ncbi:hypothetical protein FALCPG4_006132 [Fusarium falciforme]
MQRPQNLTGEYDESAIMEDVKAPDEQAAVDIARTHGRSPLTKTRSMSDGGGTPSRLSPSPHIEASRRTSKDDTSIPTPQPVTPRRPALSNRGFSIHMPPREFTPPPANPYVKPAPLSPKLDHSQIYASPTNILPPSLPRPRFLARRHEPASLDPRRAVIARLIAHCWWPGDEHSHPKEPLCRT